MKKEKEKEKGKKKNQNKTQQTIHMSKWLKHSFVRRFWNKFNS